MNSKTPQNLASKAAGRVIHGQIDFRLTPPQDGELGDTDAATAIGRGLAQEAANLLSAAAKLEGFEVTITYNSTVF